MLGSLLLACAAAFAVGRADELMFDYTAYNTAKFGTFPRLDHKSSSSFAPLLQVNTWKRAAMSSLGSHIFIRHDGHQGSNYERDSSPLIIDSQDLSAVYVNRSFPAVFNVQVQKNYNESYLTFYGDKKSDVGIGDGYCHVYDSSYREVYKVAVQNLDVKADLHEFQLTGNGTALVTAYETVRRDLTAVGGEDQSLIRDSIFQELDLVTNKVLFEWRASDHVNATDSYLDLTWPWDYFHLNSIQKTQAGDYLICARHTHALYLIDGNTGAVKWILGGKSNQFKELAPPKGVSSSNPVLSMSWQHHALFHPRSNETEITLFDNHALEKNAVACTANCSRGLHIAIDTASDPKTVRLLREYRHPKGLRSRSQGSMHVLDNDNVFIGWGESPAFTEHTPDGETVFDVQFAPWRSWATHNDGNDNYRAYRQDWKATPYWKPEIAADNHQGVVNIYVSWNGATEVRGWVVYAGNSTTNLDDPANMVARLPRGGFETKIPLGYTEAKFARAAALDADQNVIGSTGILALGNSEVSGSPASSGPVGSNAGGGGSGFGLGGLLTGGKGGADAGQQGEPHYQDPTMIDPSRRPGDSREGWWTKVLVLSICAFLAMTGLRVGCIILPRPKRKM